MKITKEHALEKLRHLKKSRAPILFSVSTKWPSLGASGTGPVTKVSQKELTLTGRDGKLSVIFGDGYEYEISGHYRLSEAQIATLGLEYFRSTNRVRCMTIRNECGEANLVFRIGDS